MNYKIVIQNKFKALCKKSFVCLCTFSIAITIALTLAREFSKARRVSLALQSVQLLKESDVSSLLATNRIKVIGSDNFRFQIAKALTLLKNAEPKIFKSVTNHVKRITEGKITATYLTNSFPEVSMSTTTAYYSLTWCASGLVHEARHIELAIERGAEPPQIIFKSGMPIHNPKAWSFSRAKREELECIKAEIAALKAMNAPSHEIRHARSQDGTHFDVNRDGVWDSRDTQIQNW